MFTRFLQSAVLAAVIALTFVPAYAQNNKTIRSGTWYEDRANGITNTQQLTLTFAQAPVDKFLSVTHVACYISLSLNLALARVTLNAGTTSGAADLGRSQSVRGNAVPEVSVSARYYSIVTNPYLRVGPGRYFSITVDTGQAGGNSQNSVVAECVIVGELSDN